MSTLFYVFAEKAHMARAFSFSAISFKNPGERPADIYAGEQFPVLFVTPDFDSGLFRTVFPLVDCRGQPAVTIGWPASQFRPSPVDCRVNPKVP